MKVALVGPALEENLALGYLSSSLKCAGHQSEIIPFSFQNEITKVARKILKQKPNLVGLSLVAQRRYPDFQKLIIELRRKGYKGHITAGGHFASLRASEILNDTCGIDSIIHHDGEERIVELAKLLESNLPIPENFDGITYRESGNCSKYQPALRVARVDSLDFPVRRKPDRTLGYFRAPIVSSRGCTGSCTFCSIYAWHKQVPSGRIRYRSPENVVDEMVELNKQHGVKIFIFHDDDFIHADKREALARCRQIFDSAQQRIGEQFAFVIKCRPDDVEENLFRYLKKMGLVRVYIGIETNSKTGISLLNRKVTPEINERGLEILRGPGVYSCFNMLIFHPETTIDELKENIDFLSRSLDHPFDIARTELYAHSTLEESMVACGRAIGDYSGFDYLISDPAVQSVFELFNEILWERHFGKHSILHRSQDLGLRLNILQRFKPGIVTHDLKERTAQFIRDVNFSTVDFMNKIIEIVQSHAGDELLNAKEKLIQEINSSVRNQSVKWSALSLEIETRAIISRFGFEKINSTGIIPAFYKSMAAALPGIALMLGTSACAEDQICDPVPPPTFSRFTEPELNQTCAVEGCHSTSSHQASLDLTTGASYQNLVNVASTQAPSLKRVAPYNEAASYLINKLDGTQVDAGGSGEKMPVGGNVNEDFLVNLKYWIGNGASNE
ncbi:MAG: radical SAM protein [bacterium]